MTLARWRSDECGAGALEFALTAPVFFAILIGVIEFGLLLWTQIGLQHGAEMAARCASVNSNVCGTVSAAQQYAAQQSYGLNPPASTFTVSTLGCGRQISASYVFRFLSGYLPSTSVTINAQACFPK
jgi:Flp pilus assembly protein TadG